MSELLAEILSTCQLIRDNAGFLASGMLLTLKIALVAVVVGIAWGTLLAMARLSPYCVLRGLATLYVNSFRAVPLVMVLLWFYLLVPAMIQKFFRLSPDTDIRLVSAMIAFALFEAAYYAEIIRAGFMGVSQGQVFASLALGMSGWQTQILIVMPQAFRAMLPVLLTQGLILFQDVTLVYALGLSDFFKSVNIIGENAGLNTMLSAMILFAGGVYFIICLAISLSVSYLQNNRLSRN